MTRLHVVHVMYATADALQPDEVLDRFPTIPMATAALARLEGVTVSVVARTVGPPCTIERDNVTWHFVPDGSKLAHRIAGQVARLKPDVVHVHGLVFPVPTVVLRARVGRTPRLVAQHHGETVGSRRSVLAQQLARRVVDAYLFTGSGGQVAPWRAAGVVKRSCDVFEVLESSADLEPIAFTTARAATGQVGSPAIVWVGRLISGKAPVTAIEAFARLAGAVPDAHLWMIYSDDRLEADVRAALPSDPDVAARIHLVGEVPHHDMSAWLSGSDVFFSTSHHEGSGYALIEALACGCTPVITDIAPHRAIAGDLGRVFPLDDAALAAEALATVSVESRDKVRAEFERRLGWSSVAQQLLAAYTGQ